ncbi:MAG: hypothetical protein CL844_04675 [Crocinitomicaceae bacterium]|nr:hypothetical protein [Crocinitomicaceae bacterium]|tara:strand:- start:62809 stop:63204 length:396 start_codon:yes stop_codon:yes gene_type:complete
MKNLPLIFSAIIIGLICYQSIFIAPLINELLSSNDASIILRSLWPKFFLMIFIISLITFLTIVIFNKQKNIAKYLSLVSGLLMFSCYFLVPIINNAKDIANENLWLILHLITIIITFITLIINIALIKFWK